MPRDILATLQAEHDSLRALFQEMETTTDRAKKKRQQLLKDIEAALIPHAKWEEFHFYPAFKERADRDGLKTHAEAVIEHQAVELTVLPEVKASDVESPKFAGRLPFGQHVQRVFQHPMVDLGDAAGCDCRVGVPSHLLRRSRQNETFPPIDPAAVRYSPR